MRIAYLDCFAGIAGDMFLGALVDAGVPIDVLESATAALNLGASLKTEKVDRSGISCVKVHVFEGDQLAEPVYSPQPSQQNLHKTGHAHTHNHPHESSPHDHAADSAHSHAHGRSLSVIRELIQSAPLVDAVKQNAIRTFDLLGAAEARIHNVPVDSIHFHEVGAVDAIVDIVAACAGIHHLRIDQWFCSPINVGGGTVVCAHGTFPVPAPATADLLRGMPTYSAHIQKELVTPTGAALLRMLNPAFGPQPPMLVDRIGYGAGTRNSREIPNVVRLSVGESSDAATAPPTHLGHVPSSDILPQQSTEQVTVIETSLDDLSPQVLAHVAETALARGALDVMLTPVIMKKGRPGTLLTVLCNPSDAPIFERLILAETSTLGIRIRQDRRSCLQRAYVTVSTPYGNIRIKVGSYAGEILNAAPEFEDCRSAAERHQTAVKQVQQAAIAAYLAQRSATAGETAS